MSTLQIVILAIGVVLVVGGGSFTIKTMADPSYDLLSGALVAGLGFLVVVVGSSMIFGAFGLPPDYGMYAAIGVLAVGMISHVIWEKVSWSDWYIRLEERLRSR